MGRIRQSPSGKFLEGNIGDTLVYDGFEWVPTPGGGGGNLAGDANGPLLSNEVNSLSPNIGGANITLDDFTSDPASVRLLVRQPAGGPISTVLPSSLGFVTEFDFILTSRADLLAVPGVGAGPNFTLPSGSYALKVGFSLDPTERMTVANGVQVLMMGMGGTKTLSGTPGTDALLTVDSGGSALLYSMNLTSNSNASRALDCAGNVESVMCRLLCGTTGGVGLRVNGSLAIFRHWGGRIQGGTSVGIDHLDGLVELYGTEVYGGLAAAVQWTGAATATFAAVGSLLQSTGGVQAAINLANANATVFLSACRVVGNGIGAVQSAGLLFATACRVTAQGGAGHALSHSGGRGRWLNSNLVPTVGSCVDASGAGVYQLSLTGCDLNSTAAPSVNFNAASADLLMNGCNCNNQQANGDVIAVLGASTVQIIGGKWESQVAARGNGLAIRGNIAGGLEVATVHGENLATDATEGFIMYVSGTVRRANISGCDTATTVTTCVNWPAANIPTLGLTLVGNAWDDPTPYNGFTAASPRVNAKANLFQTGLMQETAIVP